MVSLQTLTEYLDELLNNASIPADHSNNGLQVEGKPQVKKAVFAVDASLKLFETAQSMKADFIFVHHGLSWSGGFKRFTGPDAARFRTLFNGGISLYASHLPLDAHPELGHNACLADMLGIKNREPFAEYDGKCIGFMGKTPRALPLKRIQMLFEEKLDVSPVVHGQHRERIQHFGVISGGAGNDGVRAAAEAGLECLVTGEFSHSMYHPVKEAGLTVLSLGHYKSETPGVLAVMEHLAETFPLTCCFLDLPTGM